MMRTVLLRPILARLAGDWRFTLLSVVTLALGIGLTVAIFSLVHGVLLAPLPYPGPERLVDVSHEAPGLHLDDMDLSVPLYLRYRDAVRSFEEIALMRDERTSLTGLDVPDRVSLGKVTASIFRLSRVGPLLGRPFDEGDEERGASPVALVSEEFWRGRLGADPDVLERFVELDGTRRRIVGVLPSAFALPVEGTDVWTPLILDTDEPSLGQFSFRAVARLRDGVELPDAARELRGITDRLVEEFPAQSAAPILARAGFVPRLTPLHDAIVGDVRAALVLISAAVAFVLLMACVNVANVFLVRAEGRLRELALRSALGASRGRILSEFFAEGLALAVVGCVLGLLLARLALASLLRFAPEGVPRLAEVNLDATALAFASVLALVSAVAVALLPMVPYGRPDVVSALKEGGRGSSAGRKRVVSRRALVAVQMALGLVLLVGAMLMVRSFGALSRVSPGFRAASALTLRASLPSTSYDSSDRIVAFVEAATSELAGLPSVREVGASNYLPLSGSANGSGHRIEDVPMSDDDVPPVFFTQVADPGYQRALGMPLLEGRFFEPADHREGRRVVVVNETLAKEYWPATSALGRRISPGMHAEYGWYEIVGVVGDVRYQGLQEDPSAMTYYPMRGPEGEDPLGTNVSFVVRADTPPETLAAAARAAVWSVDPNVPITQVLTLEQLVNQSRAPMAFSMTLLLLASVLALLLGAMGTYGVVSYVTSQRRQEIGVRMALGALRGQVRGLVVRDGLATAAPGVLLGLVAALAMTRLMGSLLYAVSPLDPLSFVLATALLLAVAALASLLPAERASRVSPLEALRSE